MADCTLNGHLTAKGLSPISIRDQMVRAQMLITRAFMEKCVVFIPDNLFESGNFFGCGVADECSGIGRCARVKRLEEDVEQMHCVAARRGGTVVCQSAR